MFNLPKTKPFYATSTTKRGKYLPQTIIIQFQVHLWEYVEIPFLSMESGSPNPLVIKLERYLIPFILQTKAFQGHHLKYVVFQEWQNISLTNIFYFESYAYRNLIGNIIKSLPHTGDLQIKPF